MEEQNLNSKISHNTSRLILLSALLLIVLGIAGYFYVEFLKKNHPLDTNAGVKVQTDFAIKSNMQGEISKVFPTNIIQEKDVKILSNYSSVSKDGTHQETYRYISKNDMATNAALYRDYLNKNKWEFVVSTTDNKSFVSVNAKKANLNIVVTSSLNTLRNESSVDVTLTYIPTSPVGSIK